MFFILFTLLCTVLGQSQLAAITYIDAGTCNLESEVNVELWVNSASDILGKSSLVLNAASYSVNEISIKNANNQILTLDYDMLKKLLAISNCTC